MKQCRDDESEAQFIPLHAKNNIKRMAIEQGLYAQVVKLRQKDLKSIAANMNKNEAKFNSQGQSARSQRWFDLDFDWIAVNFSTRETDFYKIFQSHDYTQDIKSFKLFQVPIGNSKCVETFKFHNDAPILNYCQKSSNIFYFSSLVSPLVSIEQIKDDNAISLRIEEPLKSKVGSCIYFANAILKNERKLKLN